MWGDASASYRATFGLRSGLVNYCRRSSPKPMYLNQSNTCSKCSFLSEFNNLVCSLETQPPEKELTLSSSCIEHKRWHCRLDLVEQGIALLKNVSAFLSQTPRSNNRNLWKYLPWRETCRNTYLSWGKCRMALSGEKIADARDSKNRKWFAELDCLANRVWCLVHVSLCMWDASRNEGQYCVCTTISRSLGEITLLSQQIAV